MSLVNSGVLIESAIARGGAVGAFNVIQLEHAEAIVAAAEATDKDVILQLSQNAVKYHGSLAAIGAAMLKLAAGSSARVAVHLDHANSENLIHEALELGFNSIMFDGSHLDYEQNVAKTIEIAAATRAAGAWLEAELGEIGGKDGVHAPTARTVPSEAAQFVAATAVDGLAVAIGTSHAMTEQSAKIDFDLVAELAAAVSVPLVMHGSSGVATKDIQTAISHGIRKVNISTELNKLMTQAVREFMTEHPAVVDPRKYLGAGRDAVQKAVENYLVSFG